MASMNGNSAPIPAPWVIAPASHGSAAPPTDEPAFLDEVAEGPVADAELDADVDGQHRRAGQHAAVTQRGPQQPAAGGRGRERGRLRRRGNGGAGRRAGRVTNDSAINDSVIND